MRTIFLFPHSEDEFPTKEDLKKYLRGPLLKRGGEYRVVRADRYTGPQRGDVAIFHRDGQFVGEAQVEVGLQRYDRRRRIGGRTYQGWLTFDPSSVRVYEATFKEFKRRTGIKVNPQAIQKINVDGYRAIAGGT